MVLLCLLQVFPGGRQPADHAGVCHQHVLCSHLRSSAPQRVALRTGSIPLCGLLELRRIPGGSSAREPLARLSSRFAGSGGLIQPVRLLSFLFGILCLFVFVSRHCVVVCTAGLAVSHCSGSLLPGPNHQEAE